MRVRGMLPLVLATFLIAGCDDDDDNGVGPVIDVLPADFDEYDQNDDDALSRVEFDAGFIGADVFGDIDTDGDDGIEEDEFDELNDDLGDYDEYDANDDGRVTQTEFLDSLFDLFDLDADGSISQTEFGFGLDHF